MQFTAAINNAGKRLDHALHEQLPEFSRARLQDWIKQGRVLVNGVAVIADGKMTGAKPGKVLRGPGYKLLPAS